MLRAVRTEVLKWQPNEQMTRGLSGISSTLIWATTTRNLRFTNTSTSGSTRTRPTRRKKRPFAQFSRDSRTPTRGGPSRSTSLTENSGENMAFHRGHVPKGHAAQSQRVGCREAARAGNPLHKIIRRPYLNTPKSKCSAFARASCVACPSALADAAPRPTLSWPSLTSY